MTKVYRKKTATRPSEIVDYNQLLEMILNELHDKDLRTNDLLISIARQIFESVEETQDGKVKIIA